MLKNAIIAGSAVAAVALAAVIDLDGVVDLDEFEDALSEAEGAELPVGWGKD